MLRLMNRRNVGIVLVAVTFALMAFAESASAKTARVRGGGTSRAGPRRVQVGRAPSSRTMQRSASVTGTRSRISIPSRSGASGTRLSASRRPGRSAMAATVNARVSQTRTVMPRSRTIRSLLPASGNRRASGSLSGNRKSARVSSPRLKQETAGSKSRMSPDTTARIGGSIGQGTSRVSTSRRVTRNRQARSSVNSDKTMRTGGSIGQQRSAAGTTRRITRGGKQKANIGSGRTKRVGSSISKRTSRVGTRIKVNRDGTAQRAKVRGSRGDALKVRVKSRALIGKSGKRAEAGGARKNVNLKVADRLSFASRERKVAAGSRRINSSARIVRRTRNKIVNNTKVAVNSERELVVTRSNEVRRRGSKGDRLSTVIYHDRPDLVKHAHHHKHLYRDYLGRVRHRTVHPRYRFGLWYNFGHHFAFRYVYPYYHRKYVFVSLGGYWPVDYGYVRYYWYGCHPYYWYGYYPVAREVRGATYNYYTYNYYNSGDGATLEPTQAASEIQPVDHTTFADVREKLAQQSAEGPEAETLADTYFEDAVKAFEGGDYNAAAETFAKAIQLAPADMVLPFAYCQALFASERYTEAAEVLRAALEKVSPEKEEVFYPRGLYANDDILFEQIEQLAEKADLYSLDGDLQLLLGYQLLGIGEVDEAVEPLRLAGQDLENASSSAVLLGLLEKIRAEKTEDTGQ